MNNKTKQIFILSLIISITTLGILGFMFSRILAQGKLLEEQITILNENNSKQATSVRVKRLVQETEEDRQKLNASFFKDEGDSITFLSEIEELAREAGLDLRTDALDKITDQQTSQEFIKVVFSYTGKKDLVYKFSELLENIQYHSTVDSLTLRSLVEGGWEGKATVLITINPS